MFNCLSRCVLEMHFAYCWPLSHHPTKQLTSMITTMVCWRANAFKVTQLHETDEIYHFMANTYDEPDVKTDVTCHM